MAGDCGDNANDWDSWGEDDQDDQFLLHTTQRVEEEERRLQQLRNQNGPGGSNGPNMTPNLAAQAFNARRDNLPQNKDFQPVQLQVKENITSSEDSPSQLHYLNKQYANEKNKTRQLTDQLTAAQGETCNLRRQVEALKQTQQEELCCRMKREQDDRRRYEEERRELNRKLKALQTECAGLKNENNSLKTKQAVNRGVGGAQNQMKPFSSQSSPSLATAVAQKPKSDPNLRTSLQQSSLMSHNIVQSVPAEKFKRAEGGVSDRGTQVNATATEQALRDEEVFRSASTAGVNEIKIGNLENIVSLNQKCVSVRRKIFQTMHQLIKLDFQYNAKEVIESITAKAPKEIMARFTRGIEMKNCFPDLIENMFLYEVQVQQRKENAENVQKKYPKLQPAHDYPEIDLFQVHMVLERNFVHDSAWLALFEIKKQLQDLLSKLVGNMRFRLYETGNLTALWELLAFAKHLWRFVTFEEEFEEMVEVHGKTKWIKELKSWTGLILKIDWRDFYVLELEKLVREFSLSILEIIVTTGYFDSSQRRYEILYCILKDTLLKDHLRNEQLIRRCLRIITWSISDNRNILNYLCIGNNAGNCLARILGENVLKCFKELKSNYKATSIFLHYFHLLENLMVQHTPRCSSKIVCPLIESRYEDCESEEEDVVEDIHAKAPTEEAMDVELMCSQFACPEKYKFEDGCTDRAKLFNNVSAASCWINPVEWEVPMDGSRKSEDGPCQCRKVLLGSTFIMLYRVVEWWKESIVKRGEDIERRESLEVAELQQLKEGLERDEEENTCKRECITNISEKLESLQTYIIAVSNNQDLNDANAANDDDEVMERTWDVLLNNWKLPETLASDQCGFEKKHAPITIFDLAVRNGILLMNFCNFHSENIALAAGSEAFNCFTQLISDTKIFEDQLSMTEAEKRSLLEIIRSVEDEAEINRILEPDSFTDDDDDDDEEGNSSCMFLPDEGDDVHTLLKGFPSIDTQKRIFAGTDSDKAFVMMQKELQLSRI